MAVRQRQGPVPTLRCLVAWKKGWSFSIAGNWGRTRYPLRLLRIDTLCAPIVAISPSTPMFHTFHSEARLIAFNEGFSPKEGADDAKSKQLETRASAGLQRDKSTKREKDPSAMREEGIAAIK